MKYTANSIQKEVSVEAERFRASLPPRGSGKQYHMIEVYISVI
jgi:hypothetical protein